MSAAPPTHRVVWVRGGTGEMCANQRVVCDMAGTESMVARQGISGIGTGTGQEEWKPTQGLSGIGAGQEG